MTPANGRGRSDFDRARKYLDMVTEDAVRPWLQGNVMSECEGFMRGGSTA